MGNLPLNQTVMGRKSAPNDNVDTDYSALALTKGLDESLGCFRSFKGKKMMTLLRLMMRDCVANKSYHSFYCQCRQYAPSDACLRSVNTSAQMPYTYQFTWEHSAIANKTSEHFNATTNFTRRKWATCIVRHISLVCCCTYRKFWPGLRCTGTFRRRL